MILFGESLNVISKVIGKAYRERDPKPIQAEVLEQKKLGMDYIDINLGPAKKNGHELMPWVVQVVQETVPDMPLLLDTSNIAAIEAGLKVISDTHWACWILTGVTIPSTQIFSFGIPASLAA
jgi:5-methyltetrahydrofolate corrinoid/iron sulfur protein methyltransferase